MGRHAAAVGADVDPLVAAALARRETAGPGPQHAGGAEERRDGPVGWPGREDEGPAGSPLGWPGSTAEEPAERPAPQAEPEQERPRGWRRLFGGRAA
ncbi:hypothetical protein [Trujillonella endophytica]|uniref:Uncharacterized protein n=1 Tax=Trujillonella endophytica TaxID=673521 RepID=A0A1H8RJ31_9ACTN|nr:hypothetical protein [Trujillella endophytica]SEO66023.1 hypothetical protein SAMN05660991_01122 [Trujillella endophytica]